MRTTILALCLIAPLAQAQSLDEPAQPTWAESQANPERINDEIAAYEEGRAAGRYEIQRDISQGWNGYGGGTLPRRR